MTIREMTFDDIDAVIAIEREVFPPSEVWSDNGFATHLIRSDALYLVAEDGQGVHGYAGMLLMGEEGEVTKVAVEPALRRQGIGEMLLLGLMDVSASRGVEKIYLEVRHGNRAAQRLYEKAGFTVCGERKDYYLDPREDAVLFSCSLPEVLGEYGV